MVRVAVWFYLCTFCDLSVTLKVLIHVSLNLQKSLHIRMLSARTAPASSLMLRKCLSTAVRKYAVCVCMCGYVCTRSYESILYSR